MKCLIIVALLALAPPANAQEGHASQGAVLQRLVEWTSGVEAAYAPAEEALQSMRQVIRAIQAPTTPEGRGEVLSRVGPQVAAALDGVARGREAVEMFPDLRSGDAEVDAMAAAARQALVANATNVERALNGIRQLNIAAQSRDEGAVRRAQLSLVQFPPAWLRSTATSLRLLALNSRNDPPAFHLLSARASFVDACAIAADLSGAIDKERFEAHVADAVASLAIGRVALAADQGFLLSPDMGDARRALVAELLSNQQRTYTVIEQAVEKLDEAIANLADSAAPEQRLAAVREAGAIEREAAILSERARQISVQLVH